MVVKDGHALVRNVDPTESELERTTEATHRRVYRLLAATTNRTRAESPGAVTSAGGARSGEIWPSLAWGLLIVLVAETFIGNRMYA